MLPACNRYSRQYFSLSNSTAYKKGKKRILSDKPIQTDRLTTDLDFYIVSLVEKAVERLFGYSFFYYTSSIMRKGKHFILIHSVFS